MIKLKMKPIYRAKIEMKMADAGDGWVVFNMMGEDNDESLTDAMVLFNIKAKRQAENIVGKLEEFISLLDDLIAGNIDKHIDKHNIWQDDESDDPFDPYYTLKMVLFPESYDDLPDTIFQYKELVKSIPLCAIRKRAFYSFLEVALGKKFTKYYMLQDPETGEKTFVSESDIPVELKDKIDLDSEIRSDLETIELEHCFDNWDLWIVQVKRLIENKDSFENIRSTIVQS